MDTSNILIFIITAFALGAVVVMTKNNIPPKLKRGLAITTIFMVVAAFSLIVYSFWTL
jgi:mannose/fructose/N-acetylgalactosamine-specific phosphotransferase system component IIC